MKNILITEDTSVYREVFKRLFSEKDNYNIIFADNVKYTKSIIEEKQVEVILLELSLIDGNGEDIVNFVRKERKDIIPYIIIISKEVSEERILNLYKNGIDYYISKPFDPALLKATIERINERFSLMDQTCEIITGKK